MTTRQQTAACATATAVADRLASPCQAQRRQQERGWSRLSLASGALGVALLHVERARAGIGPWQRAHDWLAYAAEEPVTCSDESHLYYGAPALAFVLHGAADHPGRYARALATLDRKIAALTRRRLDRAHVRIDRGELPALSEFDAIRGLTGIGVHLLRRDPHGALLRPVLSYLVRFSSPITVNTGEGEQLPGWWSHLAPSGRPSSDFPGGHANNGVAHGIAGPLALLSLALRRGICVDGQADAIVRICTWLDQWRQDNGGDGTGAWWPYWITRTEHRDGTFSPSRPPEPLRPSWCYGTAGLARAQQLAAIALADADRQRLAEHALLSALTDPQQHGSIIDLSLCHGYAGLLQVATSTAADAITPALADCVPALLARIIPELDADVDLVIGADITFLDGAAGIALALQTTASRTPPASSWDSCLLIN